MNTITVVRTNRKDKAVEGSMFFNGVKICDTLENSDKLIPAGVHKLEVSKSPKFGRDLALVYSTSIPASRGIRIHAGNTYKDSAGCILVGNKSDCDCTLKGGSADVEKFVTMLIKQIDVSTLVII